MTRAEHRRRHRGTPASALLAGGIRGWRPEPRRARARVVATPGRMHAYGYEVIDGDDDPGVVWPAGDHPGPALVGREVTIQWWDGGTTATRRPS